MRDESQKPPDLALAILPYAGLAGLFCAVAYMGVELVRWLTGGL